MAAEAAASASAALPDLPDRRDVELLTIDPPGSRDLDQALHLERRGAGFRVHYAIADVASFVTPGGALDAEAHARGQTIYLPGEKVPLHPPVLSEGAASLLPGQDRPAFLWTLDLDGDGRWSTQTSAERWCAAAASWTTPRPRPRWMPAAGRSAGGAGRRSARYARPSRPSAAAWCWTCRTRR